MTASGVKLFERLMRLARRTMPIRLRRRRPPHRPGDDAARRRFPRLVVGRGLRRRRERRMTWRQFLEILFWTLVVLAAWSAYNHVVWGWW